MNRGRLFAAIERVEHTHSRRLGARPAAVPDKPAVPAADRPRRVLAANPAMQPAIRYAAPPPKKAKPPPPANKAGPKTPALTPAERNKRRRARSQQLEAQLRERFPAAFPERYQPAPPLAVGIYETIRALDAAAFPAVPMRYFLRFWTSRRVYLEALARGNERVNLDGTPAGLPTPEEMAIAAASLAAQTK